jgi:hypothetical protein
MSQNEEKIRSSLAAITAKRAQMEADELALLASLDTQMHRTSSERAAEEEADTKKQRLQ